MSNSPSTKISDKDLLDELKRLKEVLGRNPKAEDLKIGKYSIKGYNRAFGGISKALILIGERPTFYRNLTKEDLVNEIKRIYEETGKVPTSTIFIDKAKFSYKTAKSIMGKMPWYILLKECNLFTEEQIESVKRVPISTEDLRNEIIRLKEIYGRCPTYTDILNDGNISASAYTYKYGSYQKAMEALGFENNLRKAKTNVKNLTEQIIIDELLLLQEKLGRPPSQDDFINNTIYSKFALKKFGGLNAIKKKINISIIAQHYSDEECMEKLNAILKAKNGTLIKKDDKITTRDIIIIQCNECGHEWETTIHRLDISWCPKCAGTLLGTIEEMQEIAKGKGGECLSNKYINCSELLHFRCSEKHLFDLTANALKSGTWCPTCAVGLYERICRGHFEQLFNNSFPKIKPPWAKNSRGNLMELDGYCESLRLAFEHDGSQHTRLHKKFMPTEEMLNQRKADDLLKQKLCKDNNVILINIPELETHVDICDLKNYIKEQCLLQNYSLPENYNSIEIDYKSLYHSKDYAYLQELIKIAESKEGKLLSDYYLGNRTKLKFICKKNHIFWKDPMGIKRGQWCRECFEEDRGLKIKNYQIEKIVELYDSGLSLSEVSSILDIPATTISYHLNKLGKMRELSEAIILSKKPKLNKEELEEMKELSKTETQESLSEKFKISIKTVRKYLKCI